MSADTRMGWIDRQMDVAIARQCELTGVARATYYGRQTPCEGAEDDLLLCRLMRNTRGVRFTAAGEWSCIWRAKVTSSIASGCNG